MEERFIPVLSHFLNGNPWTASLGRLRYRVIPNDGDGEETLTAEVWEGPWAYEFSTIEGQQTFPLSEEGRAALSAWLDEWQAQIDSRPPRTMEEDLARRITPET